MHYKNIFTNENDCNSSNGENTINLEEVTCMDCLIITEIEWKRQIREFKDQPRLNAVAGLKRTQEIIKKLND